MMPTALVVIGVAALASMAAFRVTSWNNWEDFWKGALFSGSAYKSRPLQNLAAFYKLNLRNAEAYMFLRIAVRVNPNAASSLCDLADFAEKAGNFTDAEQWLERSIRNCPSFSQGWERMARIQTQLGNKEWAAACKRKIAALAAGG
jgi:tetratricopeptide (TPR) repeat protein